MVLLKVSGEADPEITSVFAFDMFASFRWGVPASDLPFFLITNLGAGSGRKDAVPVVFEDN